MTFVMNAVRVGAVVAASVLLPACKTGSGNSAHQDQAMSEQEMMEKWGQYMAVNKQHTDMAAEAGSWTMKTRMRFGPDAPWQDGTGTAEMTSVMGGRYLFEKVQSPPNEMMPQGFEGFNIAGYDNFKKKYIFCWIDNMGTGFMTGEGTMAADGKTINYVSRGPDLLTGKDKTIRFVMVRNSADSMSSAMYDVGPDGREFKSFESEYTRVR